MLIKTKLCFSLALKKRTILVLLMFTFYLRTKGIEVINIGTYYSEEDIQLTMEIIHPDLFILTCEEQKDVKKALSLVNQLSRNHKDLKIGLGGEAITEMNTLIRNIFQLTYLVKP